jgi:3-phosphoinositide dependent protein kinase-1
MVEVKKKTIEDYEFLKPIGEGAFGTVYLAKEKINDKKFAIKALDKSHIIKYNKTKAVYREKDILNRFRTHPNVIRLDCTFQVCLILYHLHLILFLLFGSFRY